MQPLKFFLRKVPGLPGNGIPPKLSFKEENTETDSPRWRTARVFNKNDVKLNSESESFIVIVPTQQQSKYMQNTKHKT